MDSSADQSDPPSGSEPEEPGTSPMAAVPPDPDVVWPEDPYEADGHAAEADADTATPHAAEPADPPWTHQGFAKHSTRPAQPESAPAADDPQTAPFPTAAVTSHWAEKSPAEPSVGKTQPPAAREVDEAMKTQPPTPAAPDEAGDEMKTAPPAVEPGDETEDTKPPVPHAEEAFETTPPILQTSPALPSIDASSDETEEVFKTKPPVPEAGGEESEVAAAAAEEGEPAAFEAEPRAQDPDSEPDLPVTAPPTVEPVAAATLPPVPMPEPEPPAAAPEADIPVVPEPAAAARPAAAAAATGAPEPLPWPAAPKPANPPIPSWAPRLQHQGAASTRPGTTNTPTWAPQITGSLHTAPPAQQPAAPAPPAAPVPTPPGVPAAKPATPAASTAAATPKPAWEVVQQEVASEPAFAGPTPEDKSYAEWFAWAKRSGAPASACHAAAQGAFRALSTGQDMSVAVQWATLAMASPPGLVGQSRQLYCAWFSLGNIDLKLPTPQAHAFATGAIQALESGADSMVAHQMGLAAAGITAR